MSISKSPAERDGQGPFSRTAEQYRANGFLGTIPLPPGEKHPPPKGFTGGGKPHPTDVQAAKWRRSHADSNIGLRLAEVPPEFLKARTDLPVIYAGNNVDGWELIGIDVDHYGEKRGADQRADLEAEHGELPATALSGARLGTGSGIAVYLVPKGLPLYG